MSQKIIPLASLAIGTLLSAFWSLPTVALPVEDETAPQEQSESKIPTFPSPYMNGKDTPLVEIDKGAKVGRDTADYWNLPQDSPKRASYDQEVVIEVADGVWTVGSPSIVNIHAVKGPDGLIIYDTGDNLEDGARFYRLLRTVTDAPIRAIIYSHEHYVNGAKVFVDEEAKRGNTDIKIIGHPNTNASVARTGGVAAAHPEVSSALIGRSIEQFNFYLPKEGPDSGFKNTIIPGPGGFVPVDTPVKNGQKMNVAGLDLVFYTDGIGTDTGNQTLVWIPDRKIALNNVVWGWFPNIYSARGGRYRDPRGWMQAIDFIRKLDPEILLSTHSTSLADKQAIEKRLQNYRDGLAFVLDQTLKGILLGKGPDELRYSVKLPQQLQDAPILVQNYGELSTMPPRIFDAIFGQYDRDAATLNKLHPTEEASRMVQAMGGEEATYDKAAKAFDDGNYLWSCQLAGYLVKATDNEKHRQLKANCLRQMGYRALSTNTRSWYLSQALALEGKARILKSVPAFPAAVAANLADYVNFYRVRISPERSADTDKVLGLLFDNGQNYALHVRRGVVDFIPDLSKLERTPDVTVSMTPETWTGVFNNRGDPSELIDKGEIKIVDGDAAQAKSLFAVFDPVYDWENDKALQELANVLKNKANIDGP